MNVEWRNETWADGSPKRCLRVSDRSDWALFDHVARELERGLEGRWVERLDDLDDRWWDLEASGGKLTLHLQHFLGISLYIRRDASEEHRPSQALLQKAYDLLSRS